MKNVYHPFFKLFIKGLKIWCGDNSVSFKTSSISGTFKFCVMLVAQGIRATGFKRAQCNEHCTKFESTTNR